ncbi:ABC transporter permease [Streptomyces sp. APSN-46.1]|uniref:ABC transporter permease n=1 Tax=Streptomyces sp. APSN-46.1 TaxID=2929049 RepID=UPI001FB2F646|nr:FtsX family ABC transporter permease [Streptomyces sp. APSN-46.1]MCJ1678526.1 ABC transporter permease [Streptomyces sp. APSN-46.1]
MLSVALNTLRLRWVTFVGTFVALALGVALIATMTLAIASTLGAKERDTVRFTSAPVIVRGEDTLRVPSPIGDRTKPLAQPHSVPRELADKLAGLGRAVPDRSFVASVSGSTSGPGTGHPWSTAAFTPYKLTSGRAPEAADEIVVTDGTAATGAKVKVATPAGAAPRTVVGTVAPTAFESAVFFTDAAAAEIQPRIDNVVVDADTAAVREAVKGYPGVHILTGHERRQADPDPNADSEALLETIILLGLGGTITSFVSVFVVSTTFAFAVAQRRREFGLLRAAGATPKQIRRSVVTEATGIGILASTAGCFLGAYGASRLAQVLVDEHIAPSWFTIGDYAWPYYAAFATGLLVALAGVWAASRRAGRIAPTEALRDAAVDSRVMTTGRWILGIALLVAGAAFVVMQLMEDPKKVLNRKTYSTQPLYWITAFAFISPVLIRPLFRLLTWLPNRLPGATVMLARENAVAGLRRTASIVAPVLITVALAGSLFGAGATVRGAKADEAAAQTTADFIVEARGESGLDPKAVARVREIPGVEALAVGSTSVYVLEEGVALIKDEGKVAEPADLAKIAKLPVIAGSVADLDDQSIIVTEEWLTHEVGKNVDVWLGDGTKASLRVAAVMRNGSGNNGVYVTPKNGTGAGIDRIDVKLLPGADAADAAAVEAALRETVEPVGGKVATKERWLEDSFPAVSRHMRVDIMVVLGIAIIYTGIALANVLVMATSDRVRDLAVLQLGGATKRQVLWLISVETILVVVVGAVLGLGVTVLNLLGISSALAILSISAPMVIPWATIGMMVAACAVLGVVSAVIPAMFALRTRPVELAGMRD